MSLTEQVSSNVEWIFSGIGVTALVGFYQLLKRKGQSSEERSQAPNEITINNNQTVTLSSPVDESSKNGGRKIEKSKASIKILFVDDDVKFQVVNIIRRNGWTNTKIIKDVASLEQPEVAAADIFFIDIQGVGISLKFKDQGLGLVSALRKRYPEKKIVIYSAENADAFHAAWGQANDRISKDADPYEFMEAVERLS